MTLLFVALLAGLWGVVFLPVLSRAREHASPITSVNSFNRGLQALGSGHVTAGGRWVVMPSVPDERAGRRLAVERRKRTFTWLLGAALTSLAFGMLPGLHFLLWIHVAADIALGAFVGHLIRSRNMAGMSRPAPAARAVRRAPNPGPGQRIASGPSPGYGNGHVYFQDNGTRRMNLDQGLAFRPDNSVGSRGTAPHEVLIVRPALERADGPVVSTRVRTSRSSFALDYFSADEEDTVLVAGG